MVLTALEITFKFTTSFSRTNMWITLNSQQNTQLLHGEHFLYILKPGHIKPNQSAWVAISTSMWKTFWVNWPFKRQTMEVLWLSCFLDTCETCEIRMHCALPATLIIFRIYNECGWYVCLHISCFRGIMQTFPFWNEVRVIFIWHFISEIKDAKPGFHLPLWVTHSLIPASS